MPIYEYVCRKCSHRFEEIVSPRATTAPPCPACSSKGVEKLLSVFAVGRASAAAATPCGLPPDAAGPGCGSCGDPRGPGACALD